jgi:hypothetical protein
MPASRGSPKAIFPGSAVPVRSIVTAMERILEHRRGLDRRRQSRGGRRADDRTGSAPLVLIVGSEPSAAERSEVVLAKLRFAVSVSASADEALRVIPGLRPDLVIANEADSGRIRSEVPENVPVVAMDDHAREDPEALVAEVRRALCLHMAR